MSEEKEVGGEVELHRSMELQRQNGLPIEVKNLIVSPAPLKKVYLGDTESLVGFIDSFSEKIRAVFWNEKGMSFFVQGQSLIVRFVPEFLPAASVFFEREDKRRGHFDEDEGIRVWEGDYAPVQFQKKDLLKYLKRYATYFDDNVQKSIQNLKMVERKSSESEMIDLEGDYERNIEEVERTTNLQRYFTALMPIFTNNPQLQVELNFEAIVKEKETEYGGRTKIKIIEVRCLNGREVVRDVMQEILSQIPSHIPRFYGKTDIELPGRR